MEPREPLDVIIGQITEARSALQVYRPYSLDWVQRSIKVAETLVPQLVKLSPGMKTYVQDVLNAPAKLRQMWGEIRAAVDLPIELIESFDRQLTLDDVLRLSVTGEVVSNVVTRHLMSQHPDFRSNGRSDYPDLYLASTDYSTLPTFIRRKKKGSADEEEYGAARKGKEQRPVRVPDGLEIKTCRDTIRVDCHHPHAGLHLALVFREAEHLFSVVDVKIAFLRPDDYRESNRNTTATTVKYSFNGDRFISLINK